MGCCACVLNVIVHVPELRETSMLYPSRQNKFRSLRRKILGPMALILVGALISSGLTMSILSEKRQRETLTSLASSLSESLFNVAQLANDLADLQQLIRMLGFEPGLELIMIVAGSDQRVVASTSERFLGLTLEELPREDIGEDIEEALSSRSSTTRRHPEYSLYDGTFYRRLIIPAISLLDPTDVAIMIHLDERPLYAQNRAAMSAIGAIWVVTFFIVMVLLFWLVSSRSEEHT